ncbi:Transcription elongation factor B polypeptide 3 [Mizuhopecten yessoensis]|uniref:Transcription elongation factor B polypeptide 3 n=1 Tax=Mizuhopecten yessoensis TaxID=6573 RepID=A0A210PQP8_MIZYE|nr:Transcription elongation factor B polypeptide 3 [Mizuhopecten yessoensis]
MIREIVLYIFTRLTEMLITIDILQRTGIGKVVNSFRKKEGEIGQLAKDIVARWRSMVAEEALRLEVEAEARESDNQGDVNSESGSESEQDLSTDGDETKEEEIRESENKYKKESVKSSSAINQRKSSSKYVDKTQVSHENVQKESKGNQVENLRHNKQDDGLKKTDDNKHKSFHSKHSGSESKHSKSDSKHSSSDSKHSSSDSKQSSSNSKHSSSDSKNKSSDSKHESSDSKHSSSNSKNKSSDSKHESSDSKHSSSNSKHSSSNSKHSSSDSKHKSSDNKHSSSDSKHSGSESKHSSSASKHTNSENKHSSSASKHTNSESKHSSSDSKLKSSESKHRGSDGKLSGSDNKQKSSEKKQDSSESKNKTEEKKHRTGNSKSEQKSSSSEKNTISEKSEKGSASLKDSTKNEVKIETGELVQSSTDNPMSPELREKIESRVGSDEDPLHWEMLETFEQIKSPNSEKSLENLSRHEKVNEERNRSLDKKTLTEQNPESEKKKHSVLCDTEKSTVGENPRGSEVLNDKKTLTKEREHSKDRDRESKHKHREKASKSHHSEQKECSTEKDKHHRDESGHKIKHSKHKHKHSDKDKEHKHSKRDKSEKREVIQEKEESKKQTSEKEDLITKGQEKERPRSSILESLSNEVDEGKFVSDDVPGLWFLNSNNNSFLAGKSDMEGSKLKEPCESSKVKVDSHSSDKDYTNSSEKSLTSEKDREEKKRHKHSKNRESSSSKHKSHKDFKSKHDSKHHRDKKRKHSGDADDSKPSKSRRKSSQDGMSFEDLLTAGATETKQSQPSKMTQNDYAKLKSKFKVKRKEDNSTSVSAKKEKGGVEMKVTEEDVLGALPQPNTHYRPWRLKEVPIEKKKTDEELLDEFIAATKSTGRTQMYSGKKQNFVPEVYKLFDMCMTVLCNNIDSLEFVGGVPFTILKPVLEKSTAAQLYRLEDFNPHFLEESDQLWMNHCHKEFRLSKPQEMESWREHYLRKFDEREEKLKKISANINASMAKKVPERTTQLAYIDSAAKPPRSVRRQQARFGTAGPSSGERSRARFHPNMDPIPIGRSGSKAVKTSAPMMAKTLTMIKKIRR